MPSKDPTIFVFSLRDEKHCFLQKKLKSRLNLDFVFMALSRDSRDVFVLCGRKMQLSLYVLTPRIILTWKWVVLVIQFTSTLRSFMYIFMYIQQ